VRLEDAFLYLILDVSGLSPREAADVCGNAIAGGADVIQVVSGKKKAVAETVVEQMVDMCRRDDALVISDVFHQRYADVAGSVVLCAVWYSHYSRTTHALQVQQTRHVNKSGRKCA